MTGGAFVTTALLIVGVAVCLLSCVGLLVLKNEWCRLHVLGPTTTVGALCVFGAGALDQIASPMNAAKPLLLIVFFWTAGALMTHAIARALFLFQEDGSGQRPEREGS